MLGNSADSWGTVSRGLHWLMALLIMSQMALGWAAVAWRLSPLKLELFVWHKSLGFLLLVLVLLRLAWRLAGAVPVHPPGLARWESRAAHVVHGLLYVLMVALPITGWVISSASNVPFRVFWLFPLPALVEPSQQLAEQAARLHLGLVLLLSLLLVAHVGAALRHHYLKRNGVLLRMLSGTDRTS